MKLFDQIIAQLTEHPGSRSSEILAEALAAACSERYGVSLLSISARLDQKNKELIARLANVTAEPDYSNVAQTAALNWLKEQPYLASGCVKCRI